MCILYYKTVIISAAKKKKEKERKTKQKHGWVSIGQLKWTCNDQMDRAYATAVVPQFPPGDDQHSLNTLISLLAACPLEVTSKLIVGLEERTFPLQLALH